MTTASELFHTRRSRSGRSGHLELGGIGEEDPPPPAPHSSHSQRRHRRPNHHHHQHNHPPAPATSAVTARRDPNRIMYDSYDPYNPGRAFHFSGPLGPGRRAIPDRDDHRGSRSAAGHSGGRTLGDRLRSFGGERLPGTVLLARERLLQRLRGVSLSSNRQRNRVSSSNDHNNVTSEEHINAAYWADDIPQEWFSGSASFADIFPVMKPKRPPPLTQEARDRLQAVTYSKQDKNGGEELCSVCLESYEEGDILTYLTCGHRFHISCLDPWLQICGDCPYCRKSIPPST